MMTRNMVLVIGFALSLGLLLLLSHTGRSLDNRTNVNESQELSTQSTPHTPRLTTEYRSEASSLDRIGNSSIGELLLLHRQKRYLLFPEGSSFQLVFDLIIPIVDYTNFAILGITCAVAWELPSKPPSELLENLRTRLNDGTLGTVRRNDSVQLNAVAPDSANNISGAAINWQPMHAQPAWASASGSAPAVAPATVSTSAYAPNAHSYPSPYYTNGNVVVNDQSGAGTSAYANSPNGEQHTERPANWHARQSIQKWRQWAAVPPAVPTASYPVRGNVDRWSDNWWQRNKERVQQNWLQKQQQWNTYEQTTQRYRTPDYNYNYAQQARKLLREPPRHHVYPVFGRRRRRRRRAEADDGVVERLHLQQHLSSRALLFAKIERLYKSRQLNGTACIQRALCESAQRLSSQGQTLAEPQSFIMELVSAIFQLPSGIHKAGQVLEYIPAHYLEAHQQLGSCRQIYGDCSHNFWLQ